MDLDPRLRSDGHAQHSSSSRSAGAASSSTSSPSSQLAQGSLAPPHHGKDSADTPSSSTVGSTPGQHQQHQGEPSGGVGNSGGRENQHVGGSSSIDIDALDAKKSRACEACRGLKVRCEPDPVEGEPCKRCRKAGRTCVVTMPTRKRQKKTDSRVSELEKKIDALTASLQARAAVPSLGSTGGTESAAGQPRNASESSGGYVPGWVNASGSGRAWGSVSNASPMMQQQSTPPIQAPTQDPTNALAFQPPIVMAGQKRKANDRPENISEEPRPSMTPSTSWSGFSRPTEGDIVDRGLISMDDAATLFNKYKEHMVRHLPAVVFHPSMTVMELRKVKPILFLALMAAASGENHALQRVLQKELMQLFAEKIVVTGEKNLELVQAIQVAVIWYWPPEHFEELKFYQLVHMAAVMAIDIGLGKKAGPKRGPPPFRRLPPPDPTSIECRRAWLTCFFLALNTSMSLHRPNLIRWTPFMTESMEILATSADAAPTDQYFTHLVWTHRLAEEVGAQFSLDDPATMVNITDARTVYALRALERDLDKYIASVPKNMMQPTLRLGFNVVNLYMHEMALHSDTTSDSWRPPFNTEALKDGLVSSEPLSAAHINALSACLSAIDGIFDTFLSMDVLSIRCLPVFNFLRVAYGVVILIKMYFSSSSPGSEMGKVINKDNMRVEHYLEALIDKFRATAADSKCRPAAKFLVVLAMLRSWFFKQGKGDGKDTDQAGGTDEAKSASSQNTRHPSQGPQQQQQAQQLKSATSHLPQSANTPLQLLSEVATTGRGDPNNADAIFQSLGTGRRIPQPFFHDVSSTITPTTPASSSLSQITGGPASVSGTADLDAAMAPAFPPWLPPSSTQQQQPPQAFVPSHMGVSGIPSSIDYEGLDLASADPQDMYENGAKIVMAEPWFTDAFQGLPDTNLFPF